MFLLLFMRMNCHHSSDLFLLFVRMYCHHSSDDFAVVYENVLPSQF